MKDAMDTLTSEAKGGVEIKRDERGAIISVAGKFLFESGCAQLRENSRAVVDTAVSARKEYLQSVMLNTNQ